MPEIAQDFPSPADETAQDLPSPVKLLDLPSPAKHETAQDLPSPAEREADIDIKVSVDVGCVLECMHI